MSKKTSRIKKQKARRSQADIAAKNFLKTTFKPVKKQLYLAWLCDVLAVGALIVQSMLLVKLFDAWLLRFLPDYAPDALSALPLTWLLVALFLVLALRAFMGFLRDVVVMRAGMQVAQSVKGRLLAQLAQLGPARRFFGSDGALASKIIDEPEHLVGYARFEVQKITAVTTPIILAICVGFYSATAAWILLLTAPLVPIFMALIGAATAKKSREQMDALAQLGGRFLDWIRGINTLTRLNAVDVALKDIDNSAEAYRAKTMSVLKVAFLNSAVLEFFSAISIALVAVYLGFGLLGILPWDIGSVSTSYAKALMILLLVPEFYAPLRRLGAEYHVKGQAISAAKAMVDILNHKHTHAGHRQLQIDTPVAFELQQVAAFGDDGRLRLSPTTLSFQAGKCTALLGESGMGKSTILQILLGFGQYTGDVYLQMGNERHHYQALDVQALRENFGYLAQTAALLPMSIAENLRLADSAASDDKLWQVLEAVELADLVRQLPQGLQTKLSERGGGISGGQAQRLAIAQLLLQDAKVWLLDEPTEHLDIQTAQSIRALLHRLAVGRTVIWVTHDVVQLQQFDAHIWLGKNLTQQEVAYDA